MHSDLETNESEHEFLGDEVSVLQAYNKDSQAHLKDQRFDTEYWMHKMRKHKKSANHFNKKTEELSTFFEVIRNTE